MEALDGRLLDRAGHPLDLAVCLRMVRLGQPVLDAVGLADHVEADWPGEDGVAVPGLLCELDPVIGQNRVDPIGHGFEHVLQELPGSFSVSRCNELSDSKLGSSVNVRKGIELALGCLHFGNVDVE